MIKLIEPFQPKIKLHIRQDFLRELWDKYVPVSSESYDKISLIYLKGAQGEENKGEKQVRILVELVLKNIVMQISMSQNPMLIIQNIAGSSLRSALKYYLAQLKRTDLQTFQALNQYITYLKQTEEEKKRFESWRSDSQTLLQMEKEYHIWQHFSESLRELSSGRAFEIERRLGNELFRSMKKPEYRILAKNMVWQERHQIAEYIRTCGEAEYRQIVERLERDPAFYELAAGGSGDTPENKRMAGESRHTPENKLVAEESRHAPENKPAAEESRHVPENKPAAEESRHAPENKLAAAESGDTPENKRMIGNGEISGNENAADVLSKEFLSERIEEYFNQEKIWKFYHKVLFPEKGIYRVSNGMLIWEKNRKEMVYHLEQLSSEETHSFWERLCGETAEVYDRQRTEALKEEAEQNRENQEFVNVCRTFYTKLEEMRKEYLLEMRESLQNIVKEIQTQDGAETLTRTREFRTLLKDVESAEDREVEVLNLNQDILYMKEMIRDSLRQEEEEFYAEGNAEKEFLLKYQNLRLSEKALQKLWSWSRAFLINTESLFKNRISKEQQENAGSILQETVPVSEENRDIAEENMVSEENVTIEYKRELQRFIEQMNDYGKQHSFHIEYSESGMFNKTVREMLLRIRELDSKQYSLFIRVLSDMIQFRRQTAGEMLNTDSALNFQQSISTRVRPFDSEALRTFRNSIRQMERKVEYSLEEQKNRIVEREIEVLNRYQDILHTKEMLRDSLRHEEEADVQNGRQTEHDDAVHRYSSNRYLSKYLAAEEEFHAEGNAEKEFLLKYQELRLSEKAVQKLWSWSRALLVNMEYPIENRTSGETQENAGAFLKETVPVSGKNTEIAEENKVSEEGVTKEYRRELQRFIEQMNDYGKQHSFHIEYKESSIINKAVQEMLMQTRKLDSRQYSLLIRVLSDMIQIRQQTAKEMLNMDLARSFQNGISTEAQSFYSEAVKENTANLRLRELYDSEVEKLFRTYYGAQMDEVTVRKLQNWSEALLGGNPFTLREDRAAELQKAQETFLQHPSERVTIEERAEFITDFRKLIGQLNEYGQQSSFHIEYMENSLITDSTEYKADFQKLIGRLNEYGQRNSFHIEYAESSLTNEAVQEVLQYTRRLGQPEYSLFIKALAGMIRVQQRVMQEWTKDSIPGRFQEMSAEAHLSDTETGRDNPAAVQPEELRYRDVERVFRSNYETQLTAEAIRELQDWSEALQEGRRPGQQEKEDFISEKIQESTELLEGDMQTEIIRQHIQQAKDRSELRRLVEQVKHDAGESVRLEYREEQITNPSIQKLLRHIRQLDEEHHRIFVRHLSKMIEVQQSMQAWQNIDSEMYGTSEKNKLQRPQRTTDGREKKSSVQSNRLLDQNTQPAGQTLRFDHRINQKIYEMYPELSHRIQEYEVRRKERYETEILPLSYFMESKERSFIQFIERRTAEAHFESREEAGRTEAHFESREEAGRTEGTQETHLIPEHQKYESLQELKHTDPRGQTQSGRQGQERRIQEERNRMKSAQEQMEVRLKQVEQQLRQAEVQTNKKEDIREAAEKIKKLLQEELHLEKLRRGMT